MDVADNSCIDCFFLSESTVMVVNGLDLGLHLWHGFDIDHQYASLKALIQQYADNVCCTCHPSGMLVYQNVLSWKYKLGWFQTDVSIMDFVNSVYRFCFFHICYRKPKSKFSYFMTLQQQVLATECVQL